MRVNVRFYENEDQLRLNFGNVQTVTASDYNKLINKPTINSVELVGALTAEDLGLGSVYYDTTEHWDSQAGLVSQEGVVYIYSDYTYIEDDVGNRTWIAGLKVGDGSAYLRDLPFVSDAMTATIIHHVSDSSMHTTPQEKAFWNNKVSSYIDHEDGEVLVLSKTSYENDGVIVGAP